MTDKTVKISSIIENQLPEFVREEFPLVQEFLSQYYRSVDNVGSSVNLIQNIDQYIKVDYILSFNDSTALSSDVSFFDTTIQVESTTGFPETYGLIQIGSEIITYSSKTNNTFEGCVRGFSGVTSLRDPLEYDQLIFSESDAQEHTSTTEVKNLSILFLKEFLRKIKKQITPGFEDRELYRELNQKLFIKQAGDFYKSKGTDSSFKILFYALYGSAVQIIKPRDYLIQPSDAQYRITKDIVAELVSGDPNELLNGTLYQDEDEFFPGASGTITNIQEIIRQNKTYYKISLDFDYNKDIDVRGSVKSNFKINPKTIVTSDILSGSTYIDVDSTVGFPQSGELLVNLENGSQLIINYQSKTLNQFLECSGISQNILSGSEIKLNKYIYGYSSRNRQEQIRFRITGVISDLKLLSTPYLYSENDTIQIKTLGSDLKDLRSNNWFFNIATKYEVQKIELVDSSDFTYRVSLIDNHSFVIGDEFILITSSGDELIGKVVFVEDKKVILITGQGEISELLKYTIKKNISKVDFVNYPELNFYSSNVQNIYSDLENSTYITSPSLPTYLDQPIEVDDESIEFFGSISGFDLTFKTENGVSINHPFYTGDSVVYKPGNEDNAVLDKGVYFVKVVNQDTIRLSRSRENLLNEQYIEFREVVDLNEIPDRIEFFDFNSRSLELKRIEPQGLIKKLSVPVNDGNDYETNPGTIGIFINGVELLNYKSKDLLFYGPIEEIIPLSGGSGYNVINPPNLNIFDDSGSDCIPHCSVEGSLSKIDIIHPGFDYIDTPTITITGGSGNDAVAKVNLISYDHNEKFNARDGVNITQNTIEFVDYHKFRDSEEVIYDSDGNSPIFGLVQNSSYFVSAQDPYTIKLHKSFNDASVGINTINLTSVGSGLHYFRSKNKKRKVGSIDIENPGFGYKNKKTSVTSVGINTALDILTIKNHGYQTGELIKYYPTETPIGGLSSSSSYYVTKLNEEQFKLSLVGVGVTNKDFYFNSKQYVDLTSFGAGKHYFNYEPIEVKIQGRIGISSVGTEDFRAIIQPVFRGEIKSVFIEDGGKNYGSDDILNFNNQPQFLINSGSGSQLTPIISDGKVVDVIIQTTGSNYESIPDLIVSADSGRGCVLTPILSNGTIVDIKVISSGFGYEKNNTFIEVVPYGTESKFEAKIKPWRINNVEKKLKLSQITNDDGFLYSPPSSSVGLEYTHLYVPRPLRSSVLSTKFDGEDVFYVKDLRLVNGKEILSDAHSPIIGWAYDGNPIYGPYGFTSPTGGSIKPLSSSYNLKSTIKLLSENRPSDFSKYPVGFFIEDYEYTASGDLDEFNGRFSVTPEFPNGVYAYFSTIDPLSIENVGAFKNYRKPVFPYVIGNRFKSQPIGENFKFSFNQRNFDLNESGWTRNTTPYNLLSNNSGYDYIINPNQERNQTTEIKNTSRGIIDNIKILNSGEDYKVGDTVIFDNLNTGRGLSAKVGSIKGSKTKKISVEQIKVDNIQLINYNSYLGIKTEVSFLRDGDIVRITTPFEFNREVQVNLKPSTKLSLTVGVSSTSTTGIITFFNVSGPLNQEVYENDLFEIENEIVKVLEIDAQNSRIKIERNINNFSGITSYFAGTIITEKNNKFVTNLGITTNYNLTRNKEFYFESNKSVGLGNTFGVGITSSLFIDTENFRSRVSIGTGSTTTLFFDRIIDRERYPLSSFVSLLDSSDSNFDVGVSKVVGVGNTFIQIDFDTSSLSVGIAVTSFVNRWNILTIPTRTISIPNHNLNLNDRLTYTAPKNGSSIRIIDPKNPLIEYDLPDDEVLFAYPVNNDLVGISTELISSNLTLQDNHLLMFADFGTNDLSSGDIHSLKVVYNKTLTASIIKNLVTVETEIPHNLRLNDFVNLNCNSGITTTLVIKYNDYNRRTIIGEYNFTNSDVNIITNSIVINNHNLITGEKVIHQSPSPCDGLVDEKIYYVFVIDSNTIRLVHSRLELTKVFPDFVQINSQSLGKFSKINPRIKITKFNTLKFDLSDSSLSFIRSTTRRPAFEFSLYTDSEFKHKFKSTKKSKFFEVKTRGIVGVTTDASLEISFNENVPEVLYYKLTPIDLNNNIQVKKESVVDKEQFSFNQINLVESVYNGFHRVIDTDPNPFLFKYTIPNYPEKSEYDQTTANLSYTTTSSNSSGPVNSIDLLSGGKDYTNLPSFNRIESEFGKNCILEIESESIGKLNSYEITDIGFDYSSDFTIRPKLKLPEIIKVEPLSVIDNIEVLFVGEKYNDSPDLLVFDGATNKLVEDLILEYDIVEKKVDVIINTEGINNLAPTIIPINNSNGFGISSISYDNSSKDVTLTLSKEFSDPEDFPFEIGSKILVENVSVASTEKGYNSENYDYKLFIIKDFDANIGGVGATISYSLVDVLEEETPGTYDNSILDGIVVPESYFPRFKVILKKKSFSSQELVISNGSFGIVESWDKNNEILKVSSSQDFKAGDFITGQSSGTKAIIKEATSFEGFYDIDSSSVVKSGWRKETGFLNNEFQRIHDSDYYQYFSYSLKSQVSFDKWKDPVEALNHTVGFKKFSDLVVESSPSISGINTEQNSGDFSGLCDFYSEINLNCFYDFDLVRENSILFGKNLKSNEIYFESKVLQDYIESIGNRVLLIDDISDQFNSNPRPTPFSIVDTFDINDIRYKKYFLHSIDKRFSNESELNIVSLLQDNSNGYLNQYGKVDSENTLGYFDFTIFGSDGNLVFYPIKFEVNNYDLNFISFDIRDQISAYSDSDLGNIIKISSHSQLLVENTTIPTSIISIGSSYRSSKVLILISAEDNSYYEIDELNIIHDGTEVYISEYGQLTSGSTSSSSIFGYGTYNSYISGSDLIIEVVPNVGYASSIVINSLVISVSDSNSTGIGTTFIDETFLKSSSVSIASSTTPSENKIISYSTDYVSSYSIISIEDITNNTYQVSELLTLYNPTNNQVYFTEFGNVFTNNSLGQITADVQNEEVSIYFTPLGNIDCEVRIFEMSLGKTENFKTINFNN
jgi:hypothetical protein